MVGGRGGRPPSQLSGCSRWRYRCDRRLHMRRASRSGSTRCRQRVAVDPRAGVVHVDDADGTICRILSVNAAAVPQVLAGASGRCETTGDGGRVFSATAGRIPASASCSRGFRESLPKGSLARSVRQLFGMIRKVFFARLGWAYAVAALNARESKMMLYALLPASIVPHLSTKIEP